MIGYLVFCRGDRGIWLFHDVALSSLETHEFCLGTLAGAVFFLLLFFLCVCVCDMLGRCGGGGSDSREINICAADEARSPKRESCCGKNVVGRNVFTCG